MPPSTLFKNLKQKQKQIQFFLKFKLYSYTVPVHISYVGTYLLYRMHQDHAEWPFEVKHCQHKDKKKKIKNQDQMGLVFENLK